jgi:predicted phage tail protein
VIRQLADKLKKQVTDQTNNSCSVWIEKLPEKLKQRSKDWYSKGDPFWNQKQLIQTFTEQFSRDLSKEIDQWSRDQLSENILNPQLKLLDTAINEALQSIQAQFEQTDLETNAELSKQLNFTVEKINDDLGGDSLWGGLGAGGVLAAGLLVFTPVGLFAAVFAAIVTAVAGSFGFGLLRSGVLKETVNL